MHMHGILNRSTLNLMKILVYRWVEEEGKENIKLIDSSAFGELNAATARRSVIPLFLFSRFNLNLQSLKSMMNLGFLIIPCPRNVDYAALSRLQARTLQICMAIDRRHVSIQVHLSCPSETNLFLICRHPSMSSSSGNSDTRTSLFFLVTLLVSSQLFHQSIDESIICVDQRSWCGGWVFGTNGMRLQRHV
ncbi:hypothetical protein BT96DRAFT_352082 [Gymnopus androsaceus JB14]|uniref:Uncharacterized protein n=1 Tax=Gymnopus androsaceus JB14 TaxID=1447944 RepID=A0A6A4GXT3_9AGAR|nr:hypothetical protein BT96DRAFT_352082 [Gymnopus androsaceus JB14]